MPQGKLQVVLVSAKGLENTDFLCNMDPYVLLTCRTQEQKSSVASGKGSEPEWNEDFIFNISEGASELALKIMDSDAGSQDDFVGEVANVKAGILKLKNLLEGGSSLHTLIRQATYSFQP
ncbi:hypothetical protein V6Z11_A11G020000 [Gossypium hirsutum]|uniref:Elicitor-responsive protein 3 isoform X2 n=2 Tax=Gossypium TaxID=3633 RepID=A0A1U8L1E8_GOSHI|nr:elicitor-responsive protein 3 isoform X2 [Gossypium hirsutum]TYG92350.1 hypothetical protein ES288_A11G023100v1 [Gossypium darwinii]